jgi:DNA-binding winged helix-turn-helix (wHTH) protein/TolB-like protein
MSLERFQFGEFEFDSETRVLTHKGREIRLQAQPALLLGVLLARRGQIVSREDLQRAIWGNDTHVDFEKGLNFCTGQVRAALRDDASRPVYIQTVPRQGYRFIAPVIAGEFQAGPIESDSVRLSSRSLIRWPILVLAATVIAIGTFAFLWAKIPAVPNLAVVRFDTGTSKPTMRALADELTDDVTVRLTSASNGHYRVIGNASILRAPREQRDLRSIASSLRCKYAVLGQVEADGDRVLVLAHLIRLSDLTHIRVVRIERKAADPSMLESQMAEEIASQFAASMSNRPDGASSFRARSH